MMPHDPLRMEFGIGLSSGDSAPKFAEGRISKDHGNVLFDCDATRNSFWAPALLKLHVRLSSIQIRNAFGEGALFFFHATGRVFVVFATRYGLAKSCGASPVPSQEVAKRRLFASRRGCQFLRGLVGGLVSTVAACAPYHHGRMLPGGAAGGRASHLNILWAIVCRRRMQQFERAQGPTKTSTSAGVLELSDA